MLLEDPPTGRILAAQEISAGYRRHAAGRAVTRCGGGDSNGESRLGGAKLPEHRLSTSALAKMLQLFAKSLSVNPKYLCCTSLIAIHAGQDVANVFCFHFGERSIQTIRPEC